MMNAHTQQQCPQHNRSFTEAVPLSLSSMAHMSFPLEEGVLDGLKQILQHTLFSCVNYARAVHSPYQWTFADLITSPYAWKAKKNEYSPSDLPWSLMKLNFKYQYTRNAWIYFQPALNAITQQQQQSQQYQQEDDDADILLEDSDSKTQDLWIHTHNHILGRVTLLYVTNELLTKDELDGTDVEDMPPIILYKVLVEYRSLPATGKQGAVQAEELSMLSFGGSVDDDLKLGALASLYDEHAKYVLEMYSVRGKKYKFDLMDATLSDGTVPQLPSTNEHDPFSKNLCVTVTDHDMKIPDINDKNNNNDTTSTSNTEKADQDIIKKVEDENPNQYGEHHDHEKDINNKLQDDDHNTDRHDGHDSHDMDHDDEDHQSKKQRTIQSNDDTQNSTEQVYDNNTSSNQNDVPDSNTNNKNNKKINSKNNIALTRIHLMLDGNLRKGKRNFDSLPRFDYISNEIQNSFILLNPNPPLSVTCTPSNQKLLTDVNQAGNVYINGKMVTKWGDDPKIGDHNIALFGMDLRESVPFWHNQITDYNVLKKCYAQLWQEILIDAKLLEHNLGRELLMRLIYGINYSQYNSSNNRSNGHNNNIKAFGSDDDSRNHNDEDTCDIMSKINNVQQKRPPLVPVNSDQDCLESQILSNPKYDPVGIASKALSTKFRMEFGKEKFPCIHCDVDYVKNKLPHLQPMVVPQRVINILRRGGYFDSFKTHEDLWFTYTENIFHSRNTRELQLCITTVQLLNDSQCFPNSNYKIKPTQIKFVTNIPLSSNTNEVGDNKSYINGNATTADNNNNDAIRSKNVCAYNSKTDQYHINEALLKSSFLLYLRKDEATTTDNSESNINNKHHDEGKILAYLLGMYIAQAHPDGSVLIRYLLRCKQHHIIPQI